MTASLEGVVDAAGREAGDRYRPALPSLHQYSATVTASFPPPDLRRPSDDASTIRRPAGLLTSFSIPIAILYYLKSELC